MRRHYPERYTKSRVSIHAPWEGCDDQAEEKTCEIAVSIHAPWEGCDAGSLSVSGVGSSVSIHAPWEGCDTAKGILECKTTQFQFTHPGKGATTGVPMSLSPSRCFNSRTLGRVRRYLSAQTNERKSFNSRTLGRVRLYSLASSSAARLFQFTHPGKGATWCKSTSWRAYQCFNSRTLGRVRRGMEGFPPREPSFNSRTLGRVRLTLIRCNYAIACFNSRTLGRVRRTLL